MDKEDCIFVAMNLSLFYLLVKPKDKQGNIKPLLG